MLSMHLLIVLTLISSLSASSCKLDVGLEQELHNEGFHRNLTYKITFQDTNKISLYEDCYVGLDQVLPPGVFASHDELGDLLRTNKLTAIPKNRVNVELPAEESQPSSVFIIGRVNDGVSNMWLPVHGRYHRAAKGGGLYRNEIERARVFVRCPQRTLDECEPKTAQVTYLCSGGGKETCVWKEVHFTSVSKPMEFAVPVGDVDHYGIVASATASAVVAFSLYLMKTLHDYNLAIKRR